MSKSHFNFQTMAGYRRNKLTKGYNPFDYPEEWEFFRHPFATDEEDDVLADLFFQIRKMSRRLHLYFDNPDYCRMETAFYFGLLDSLSETDDYILGALWYARYCRLEKLFLLTASQELGTIFERIGVLKDELLSVIRSFGDKIGELNQKCLDDDLVLRMYCNLTQNGITDDMLCALMRAPGFPSDPDKTMKLDENTNIFSYLENVRLESMLIEEERNVEGACDLSGLDNLLEPVDMLLWKIRGTLLWVVIKKIMWVFSNISALGNRHNKLVTSMWQDAFDEVCGVYARSKAYAKKRDEDFPRQCAEEFFIQGRKPTNIEIYTYFNTHYRNFQLINNQSQQLFHQYRKQENKFRVEFLNLLLDEDTREDAEEFLFVQTFGKELNAKQKPSYMNHRNDAMPEKSVNAHGQTNYDTMVVKTLIAKNLKIEDGSHCRFPECLSVENAKKLYEFLSQEGFIDREKTPLADFNYRMGASKLYTTPDAPKSICWLSNKQMLREMLFLAFATLLENGTTKSSLEKFVPECFVDKNGKPIKLAKNDERQIIFNEMVSLENFFTTISRPNLRS